jgi:hypothetical protein
MRTLTRPMFNMGGPIKQGIMNGIREPYKGGGAALVGNPAFPKTGGREHHYTWIPSAINALRAVGTGLKAGRMFTPGKLSAWNRFKSMLGPSGRFRDYKGKIPLGGTGTSGGKAIVPYGSGVDTSGRFSIMQALKDPKRFGMALRENPITALTAATLPATAIDLGRKHGADVAKGAWTGVKRYGDMLIPGDQSDWWKEKEAATGVPLNPNLQKEIAAAKELSGAKKKEFALKQREDRVQKYLKMMGYDQSKKLAIADALIDASKIVGDRGTLDLKNITQELISPVIQATSKRLDKPQQIREAVGLMTMKAEIEKDLEDPSIKALRLEQLKGLRGGFSKDIGDFILSAKGTKVKPKALEQFARARANEHNLDFTVVTDEMVAKAGEGASQEEVIQSVVSGDGVYLIGDAIIQVTGGVPKRIA